MIEYKDRKQLTLPLRVGPWWVGMLAMLAMSPVFLLFTACVALEGFFKGVTDATAEFAGAIGAIWRDRKR